MQIKSIQESTNEAGPVDIDILQQKVMRFADLYVTTVAQACDETAARVNTPEVRLAMLRWKLNQATAAFINASDPNPALNALDMLVLVTLSRMVVEDYYVKTYGDEMLPLLEAHRKMETDAWALANGALKPKQQQELRDMIADWRQKNPDQRYIGAVRFREFAVALGRMPKPENTAPTSIFSLLFLDPLAGLDPTAAAIEQTRLLGERAMYYSQRMPMLLSWQTEVLAYQLTDQPETKRVLDDASRLAESAQSFARTASQLPGLINDQRQAAIQQVFDNLNSQQGQMRDLMANTRETFNAGSQMAQSVNEATKSLDSFVRFVSSSNTNETTTITVTNRRPFDVMDYGKAAGQIGDAARELNTLLTNLNASAPKLAQISQQSAEQANGVVSHATQSGILLITFFLVGSVLAALVYRIIYNRWFDVGKKRLDN